MFVLRQEMQMIFFSNFRCKRVLAYHAKHVAKLSDRELWIFFLYGIW